MALDATRLKNAIKAAVDAIDVDGGEITNDAVLTAFCDAIVSEITDNAEIYGNVTVSTGTGIGGIDANVPPAQTNGIL